MKDLDAWMNAMGTGEPAGMAAEDASGNRGHREEARAEGADGNLTAGNEAKLLVHGCENW
jgi:hypothetical protein